MLRDSQTAKDTQIAKKLLTKAFEIMDSIECEIANDDKEALVRNLFEYEHNAEKIINNARLLPVISGIPNGKKQVEEIIISENNVSVGYTKEGWFHVMIPSLLPKKEKGDPSYIRTTLNAAMARYFKEHERVRYEVPCVIIFRHNYAASRNEREYRDHDNIELNAVVDMIALHVLVDDSPLKCRHYYCSKVSENDFTDVFVVPKCDFMDWLSKED